MKGPPWLPVGSPFTYVACLYHDTLNTNVIFPMETTQRQTEIFLQIFKQAQAEKYKKITTDHRSLY